MKKYKLIIADDEEIIRETLANYVDWNGLGFEIVLVAEDGQQVMDFLDNGHADAVLTDIQMRNGSGLSVADYIFHKEKGTKIIFLSGYQEFEFAKKAITYQVKEYLLKPISITTIETYFRRLWQELQQEEQEKSASGKMKEESDQLYPVRQMLASAENEESFMKTISHQFLLIMNMADDLDEVSDRMMEGLFESIRGLKKAEQMRYVKKIVDFMERFMAESGEFERTEVISEISSKNEVPENYFKRCVKALYEQLHQGGIQKSVAEQTGKLIMQRITETVTLKEAADAVFLSPNYFSYVFKEQSGEKFSDFCIRLKMEKAAELLRCSRYKVFEISDYLGYKNIKYFYKLFKRVYHCTPTEYREAAVNGDQDEEGSVEIY